MTKQKTINYADSFQCKSGFDLNGEVFEYFSLAEFVKNSGKDISHLPITLKILLENLLRNEQNSDNGKAQILSLADWKPNNSKTSEIAFSPARVLMQDFTGVPAIVDLAVMRDALADKGYDPQKINPQIPVDLVIDHSVSVDFSGNNSALRKNTALEFTRNRERYEFLKWGQKSFDNFRVVPPGTGICHQINLEYLGQSVFVAQSKDGTCKIAYPDTLVGTDSHTTMINALGVLGWGVGGIEAEAAMLGQAVSMLIPEVIGFKLSGSLPSGATATDMVLKITQMLREKGVVGKFIEFFGSGLGGISLPDRATISNMSPEFGSTCAFFPVDDETLKYLRVSGRSEDHVELVEKYSKIQGIWRDSENNEIQFSDVIELDLSDVVPCVAGPKRPQDRIKISSFSSKTGTLLTSDHKIENGDIVLAAITSCTNTSNPSVMIAAGIVARKAYELGLEVKPWVKTSLAPGSQVVSGYLEKSGLQKYLDSLGFSVVGYGCTTCIGNSGSLSEEIIKQIDENNLNVSSVLSGNRNFEGRINQHIKSNYLASPPLVVAYALAGTMNINLLDDVIGRDKNGNDIYLRDIWASKQEIEEISQKFVTRDVFTEKYRTLFEGTEDWKEINSGNSMTYSWSEESSYIRKPPYFEPGFNSDNALSDIKNARCLVMLGDSVTTDHISPAGAIKRDSPAGKYLSEKGIAPHEFNSYGSRRGNHEVMMRGTFANIRIRNEMLKDIEGGMSVNVLNGDHGTIYDTAIEYKKSATPLIVIAGKEYGTGSSRDWAAKGTKLLGVKAVIAESFERIHRSNLIGMGVLPLQFTGSNNRVSLGISGYESFDICGIQDLAPKSVIGLKIKGEGDKYIETELLCRIDTPEEMEYYIAGGILPFVLSGAIVV